MCKLLGCSTVTMVLADLRWKSNFQRQGTLEVTNEIQIRSKVFGKICYTRVVENSLWVS